VPLPVPDDITAEFWAAVNEGTLKIQRCADCGHYQQPPGAVCALCTSASLAFEPVSGRATVYSYTEVASGARHPAFAARTPYLVGLVELVEQRGLLMYSNFPGSTLADLKTGADVVVEFERVSEQVALPQFRLVSGGAGE
jgi:uncharacterized OB-fold protein